MSMVFCRGCGKEIHETATMCPHCGYQFSVPSAVPTVIDDKKNLSMAVVSFVFSLAALGQWSEMSQWTKDTIGALWLMSFAGITLSTISLSRKYRGKKMNIFSLIVLGLTITLLLGKLPTQT